MVEIQAHPDGLPSCGVLPLHSRLALLMFLQFAFPSTVVQLFSIHLNNLGFSPLWLGCCCATQSLATVLVATLVGQAADRWFSAERCVAVCSLLASLALWILADLTDPVAVFVVTLLFWLLTNPVLILGTTICFTHLSYPEKHYGSVRLWGTVGWMVPGWLLLAAVWLHSGGREIRCTDLFRMGSMFALVLAVYAALLPHTPPQPNASERSAPLAALRLLRSWPFAVYFFCTLGVCITWPFTSQATPLLLENLGVPLMWMSPTLTLAQTSEVLMLGFMPLALVQLGIRGTMLLGLVAWTAAMWILTVGEPLELVIASLGLNGFCVTGFLVTGQVFVNRSAHGDVRASVQALLVLVNGFGNLLGHLLVGVLRWQTGGQLPRAFAVAAGIVSFLLVFFWLGFRDDVKADRYTD